MKAILVIDFCECDDIEDIEPVHLSYRIKSKDLDMGYYLATKDIKLKLIPEKELIWNDDDDYQMGWNDCIDEILGEE